MTWIASLEEERQALEHMIAERANDTSPSVRLSLASLRRRLEQILARLDDCKRPKVRIDLTGSAVAGTEIKLDALGPFLDELQETVSSIGQALRGSATAFSSIPSDIRDQTSLSLEATAPGSIVLHLRAPADPRTGEELPFPETTDRPAPLAVAAVERLILVARDAQPEDLNEDALVDDVYPLGPRTHKHLNSLLRIMADSGIDAELSLFSPVDGEQRANLSATQARRIHEVLKRARIGEETQERVGALRGVSSLRNAFELVTPEGEVIAGKVREDLVPQLRNWYERQIIATLEVTVSHSFTTGITRTKYLLIGMADTR
ncbi:hypothetical protein OUY22_01850 [Nonomuraea sp. MCN248]|uniref:Fido domain-containing protein n=1 Tax=Nonomuraea corallina TaxID=2989783 RepID=A0ABT4S4K8_9ACTN|nr:hypothetical protein [Nonomuraea corallina]MDA0632143.1 hypothetical protein [Nonomuraea corallina]